MLPVRWSLERAPRGERRDLRPDEEASARTAYDEIVCALPQLLPAPPGWELPEEPSFEPDQRYGPCTPLVLARAAQIWSMSAELLAELTVVANEVDAGGSVRYAAACAAAEARPLGLDDALERLSRDVAGLCEMKTSPRWAGTWKETVRLCVSDDPDFQTGDARREFAIGLRGLLRDATYAATSVAVLGAHATRPTRLAGLGPLLATIAGEGVAPGEDWTADKQVVQALRLVLFVPYESTLVKVAQRHDRTRLRDAAYDAVVRRLLGWAVTSAACSPPVQSVLGPSSRARLGIAVRQGVDVGGLQTWATCVTSALTHRVRLSAEDVTAFCSPFRDLLPGLERRMNEPL